MGRRGFQAVLKLVALITPENTFADSCLKREIKAFKGNYFYAPGVLNSDLFQEGCIGLYTAIQKYQPAGTIPGNH